MQKRTLSEYAKYNHIPGAYELGNKDKQWLNIKRLMKRHGVSEFPFIMESYVLPEELEDFRNNFNYSINHSIWILKPFHTSRSRGIKMISKLSELESIRRPVLAQKYLASPFLFNGRKIEPRYFVLITSVHPLRLYRIQPKTVFRVSMSNYTLTEDSVENPNCIHFNPVSMKTCASPTCATGSTSDYCQYYTEDVEKSLIAAGIKMENFQSKVDDAIVKSFISVEKKLTELSRSTLSNSYNSYHLFGVDFIVESDGSPKLLEINTMMRLIRGQFNVLPKVLSETLNIVGYHLPPSIPSYTLSRLGSKFLETPNFDINLYDWNLTIDEKDKHRKILKNIPFAE